MTSQAGSPEPGAPSPRRWPGALWRGETPLAVALWRDALLFGTAANLVASLAALAAISVQAPDLVGLLLFLLPTPYYILATVGVWRSADAYPGPQIWAGGARVLVSVWLTVVLVI